MKGVLQWPAHHLVSRATKLTAAKMPATSSADKFCTAMGGYESARHMCLNCVKFCCKHQSTALNCTQAVRYQCRHFSPPIVVSWKPKCFFLSQECANTHKPSRTNISRPPPEWNKASTRPSPCDAKSAARAAQLPEEAPAKSQSYPWFHSSCGFVTFETSPKLKVVEGSEDTTWRWCFFVLCIDLFANITTDGWSDFVAGQCAWIIISNVRFLSE